MLNLFQKFMNNYKIGIIGTGYVGLPLAISFSKYFEVIGFDKDKKRVLSLSKGKDKNLQFQKADLKSKRLNFTSKLIDLKKCNIYIITLPTPLKKNNLPDLKIVNDATLELSRILKKNDIVIYESTVYPGATEQEFCKILEKNSKLTLNKDFYLGYSPERINPGDKKNTIQNITKVVSASNKNTLNVLKKIYGKIIKAGIKTASSIQVAELSKVLENTQRFVNIALINEISQLCNKLNLQTKEVVDVASTKWNFAKYYPGLVGGHCIAVDPLYLSYKSKYFKLDPDIINTSHKINNNVQKIVVENIISKINIKSNKILILGLTFKENCPDTRNSGVYRVIKLLNKKGIIPEVHDPYVKKINNDNEGKFKLIKKLTKKNYLVVVIAVSHKNYIAMGIRKIKQLSSNKNCKYFDLKSIFNRSDVDFQL